MRTFMRAVWGIYSDKNRILKRRRKIDDDIDLIIKNEYNEPFIVYVMGEENYKALVDKGFNCKMIHDEPFMFDITSYQYRHKLECIKYAMEKDNYDEVVYLDWDCSPTKKIPKNFWETMREKGTLQANLQQYKRTKCRWRAVDKRKVPNGGFLYIADQNIPSEVISRWDRNKQDNDEPAWARYIDDVSGGWRGLDHYWDNYESTFCDLRAASAFPANKLALKDTCFLHTQGGGS